MSLINHVSGEKMTSECVLLMVGGWWGRVKWDQDENMLSLTSSQGFHWYWRIGHCVGITRGLQVLRFSSRSVLVLRVILHVLSSDSLGLVNERSLLFLSQQLPLWSKTFRDLWSNRLSWKNIIYDHKTHLNCASLDSPEQFVFASFLTRPWRRSLVS